MFDLDINKINKDQALEKCYDRFIESLETSTYAGEFEDHLCALLKKDAKKGLASIHHLPARLFNELKTAKKLHKIPFGRLVTQEFDRLLKLVDAKSRKINALKAEIAELKQAQSSQQ